MVGGMAGGCGRHASAPPRLWVRASNLQPGAPQSSISKQGECGLEAMMRRTILDADPELPEEEQPEDMVMALKRRRMG